MGRTPAVAPGADEAPLERRIKAQAYALGFDLCGIARLGVPQSHDHFERWLSLGRSGAMAYMSRYRAQRGDSRLVHPGATTAIVVAMNYGGRQPSGPIARYARGDDYHEVMGDRLRSLLSWLVTDVGHPVQARPFVDTAPILERDLARKAGLGWIGKNTNLINPRLGSYFFIGSLFVNLDLATDAPFEADRCGTCRRCIDACPTGAIVAPHELDARLCVSYLTIELRDEIAPELRPAMGELVYGCDICQEVCPWNVKFADDVTEPRLMPRPENVAPEPTELLALTDAEFRLRFHHSAIKRAKRPGLARNATVALGNRRSPDAVPALRAALADPAPLVQEHAAWALRQIGTTRE